MRELETAVLVLGGETALDTCEHGCSKQQLRDAKTLKYISQLQYKRAYRTMHTARQGQQAENLWGRSNATKDVLLHAPKQVV